MTLSSVRFTKRCPPNWPLSAGLPEKDRRCQFHVTGPARRDIAAIMKWSLKEFGMNASLRYSALLRQALLDIEADSERPGSKERPELMVAGARTYHISLSRTRVIPPPMPRMRG